MLLYKLSIIQQGGSSMSRKAVTDGGKRDEIINAALNLFFEQGYEGTSVRSIMIPEDVYARVCSGGASE